MAETITTISPITNKPVVERKGLSDAELKELPIRSAKAFESFKKTSLKERQAIVKKALELLTARQDELAKELTEQMGRPIAYTAKEITTAVARGEYMLKISEDALADTPGDEQEGFIRYVRKVPMGPVLVLFAWNVCWEKLTASFTILPTLTMYAVPISDLDKFHHSRSTVWKHCHSQTFATDSYYRRAYARDPHRSRRSKRCCTILPLR